MEILGLPGGRVALGQSDGGRPTAPSAARPGEHPQAHLARYGDRFQHHDSARGRRLEQHVAGAEFGAAFPGRRTKPVDGERPARSRPCKATAAGWKRRPSIPRGVRRTAGHSGWTPRLSFGRWRGWEPSFRLAAKTCGSINAYKRSRLPGAGAELIRRHRQCGDRFGPLVLGVMRLSHPVLTLPSLRSQHGHPMPGNAGPQ